MDNHKASKGTKIFIFITGRMWMLNIEIGKVIFTREFSLNGINYEQGKSIVHFSVEKNLDPTNFRVKLTV